MVSLVTEPIPEQYLYRLTFWSRKSTKVRLELDKSADAAETLETKPITATAGMATEPEDLPWWRKIFNFLCGVESASNSHNVEQSGGETKAEKPKTKEELAWEAAEFLQEEPWWRTFVNVNAVVLMAVTIFFIGFYA